MKYEKNIKQTNYAVELLAFIFVGLSTKNWTPQKWKLNKKMNPTKYNDSTVQFVPFIFYFMLFFILGQIFHTNLSFHNWAIHQTDSNLKLLQHVTIATISLFCFTNQLLDKKIASDKSFLNRFSGITITLPGVKSF